ncbi:hypothetical protein GIY30_00945 [Gordonia sp. HNM0687]|uniref:Uncharacterized protein n=1 Tax=Gordonia mangrovi TaxID=2665643 RepID=A0A6L7GKA4_9ACTN|nr:hypothetical protein [Gordonia mangrovi]MXP19932.1 hypothetical protein [Gordonia mangrovi]UVF79448.1 hypothetical protein NWF22_06305 [Gordonia mangrovi]
MTSDQPMIPDPADSVNPELTTSVDAEDLDEDRLQLDPLEDGIDPPEGWSAADRTGVTTREQREGETLDERLAEEEPDIDEVPDGDLQTDGTGDSEMAAIGGQTADEAGGSMAAAQRTPGFDEPR